MHHRPKGDTQQNIFRFILRFGGSVKEPKIQKYLLIEHEIASMHSTKKHLKAMLDNNLIIKQSTPGSANIISLAIDKEECIEYLSNLIKMAHMDPTIYLDLLPYIEENDSNLDKLKNIGFEYNILANEFVEKIEKNIGFQLYDCRS